MNDLNRLALVTGASSGIGRAFARQLGAAGYDLVVVGRRRDRLDELAAELSDVTVRVVVSDLGTDEGIGRVAEICANEDLSLLVNNAGVSHYMAFTALPAGKATELLHVKVVATTLLAHAAAPGMVARKGGSIINVAGMLGFSGPAPLGHSPGRAIYVGTLAHIIAMSQALDQELGAAGIRVQALCPGLVATEFHERQGMDLSALPRMTAEDLVAGSLRGLELGETVCAPGVEQSELLDAIFRADLAAFQGQSPTLAQRYRT
ncbi:SDR family NAD(P)-dependent oxidoreductase [Sphingopyxis sp.]|uniref:SDR family NAD(P)-dependent oxidoreductase n=1 Tax=Sphingopyxis sp. TaxID=1908224 RepID=UPI003BAD56E1